MKVSMYLFAALGLVGMPSFGPSTVHACGSHHHHEPNPHDHEDHPALDLGSTRNLEELTEQEEAELFFDTLLSSVAHHGPCASASPTEEEMAQSKEAMDDYAKRRRELATTTPIVIPVVVHRILFEPERPFGATDEQIEAQMEVLNDAFAPHFSFVKVNQTETYNARWYPFISPDTPELTAAMKTALHQGGPDTLNMYLLRSPSFATFPQAVKTDPILDGIVVSDRTVPGGRSRRFNEGKMAVHEVGHWLGLYHTFEGGCTEPNDFVKDTNPQAAPTEGCPAEPQDTCVRPKPSGNKVRRNKNKKKNKKRKRHVKETPSPGSVSPFDNGPDPIHNYMDYSDDVCKDNFTQGQIDRMLSHWHRFRKPRGHHE